MLKRKDRLAASVAQEFNIGKVKQKDHNELRYLKGIIRDLQKENRSLRKELAYHKKHQHQYEESLEETEEEKLEIDTIKNGVTCDNCGKGILKEFEIMGKIFGTCPVCDHRKKLK